jgi:predicted nucleic acid-binding protein
VIILDTNVVSEPMKPKANPAVRDWLDQQVAETLYLTAISLSELLLGVELLPDGKRKEWLAEALNELICELFGSRILPFDHKAAAVYAPVIRRARTNGQAISVADGQIAAIATLHGLPVATRDTAPYSAAGVPVINPWKATER